MPRRQPPEDDLSVFVKIIAKADAIAEYLRTLEEWHKKKDRTAHEFDAVMMRIGELLGEIAVCCEGLEAHDAQRRQALLTARAQLDALNKEVERLKSAPFQYACVLDVLPEGQLEVSVYGRRMRVSHILPASAFNAALIGGSVLLNNDYVAIGVGSQEARGEVVRCSAVLGGGRVRVTARHDEELVATRSSQLSDEAIAVGDELLFDYSSKTVLEVLAKNTLQELLLERVPDITYEKIGGLKDQISQIRRDIELPFTRKDLCTLFEVTPPKGILLYGPPGCGKTLIAKAIARSLADRLARERGKDITPFFISVDGPEILNKFVGETEKRIREIFDCAARQAIEDHPVVVFFDEADALFNVRGSGISSDVNRTIVAQLLAVLDGLKTDQENILVILASNRQDLIDPALLRPGRIDRKIRIPRPDKEGAREIFKTYVPPTLPLHPKYTDPKHPKYDPERYAGFAGHPERVVEYIIDQALLRLWATKEKPYRYRSERDTTIAAENAIMELTTETGSKLTLHLCDVVSGAMIKNIVERAKKNAIERVVGGGDTGLATKDFCTAIEQEMIEVEDLPHNGDDIQFWLDIMQGKHERIVHVRSLIPDRRKEMIEEKKVDSIQTGHYF